MQHFLAESYGIGQWEKPWSPKNATMHLRSEMELFSIHEDGQSTVSELLHEVQRARRVLLNADDKCIEKAERHYRHILGVSAT